MNFINVAGNELDRAEAFVPPDNRSYRYGDGLFETMKVQQGRLLLADLHFDRLFAGLSCLQLRSPQSFTRAALEEKILSLCHKNNCQTLARVRLSVSGGSGGMLDGQNGFLYIIECWPLLVSADPLNQQGLLTDVFPSARKSCDSFANLKSASHLVYAVASRFAILNGLDDCVLLNVYGRVCDSTIANVFWIRSGKVFTPPLSEGPVAGVMRRCLIEKLQSAGIIIEESICTINDLANADEVFFTNAIQGIKWVKNFGNKAYGNQTIRKIQYDCALTE